MGRMQFFVSKKGDQICSTGDDFARTFGMGHVVEGIFNGTRGMEIETLHFRFLAWDYFLSFSLIRR
jgi:hypothetical protein